MLIGEEGIEYQYDTKNVAGFLYDKNKDLISKSFVPVPLGLHNSFGQASGCRWPWSAGSTHQRQVCKTGRGPLYC